MPPRIRHLTRIIILWLAAVTLLISGCQSAMKPEQTPERIVIGFLKAVGRSDFESAKAFVVPESQGEIQNWTKMLFFPDHATPPSQSEADDIDRFIGLFYKITPTSQPKDTDTQLEVRLTFSATDALVGFPSVVNNPMVPNSALLMVQMSRTITGEGKDAKVSDWSIVSIKQSTEHV
jgi:hypothetical protein